MAEFHIGLQYISKQHTGAENAFLLRIFDPPTLLKENYKLLKLLDYLFEILRS